MPPAEYPRSKRTPSYPHDTTTPAWRVIHDIWGGPSAMSRSTKIPVSTIHEWLYRGFVPGKQMAHIRACAKRDRIKLPVEAFVPEPKFDPRKI